MNLIPNRFFLFRTISVLLDEAWIISIPLFTASHWAVENLAKIMGITALGDLIGIILFPFLASKFKSSSISIGADLLQAVSMSVISVSYYFYLLNIDLLCAVAFFSSIGFAIWFAASDTFFTAVARKSAIQSLQKKIALSQNFGPILGPSIGAVLFSILNIGGIAILNGLSFLGQIFNFYHLSSLESQNKKNKSGFSILSNGLKIVALNPILSRTLIYPIIAKIFVFGFLPFLAFYLKRSGISDHAIGFYLAPYGIGVFIGSILYKKVDSSILGKSFQRYALLMCFLSFLLIFSVLLNVRSEVIPIYIFFLGIVVSHYQIMFRSLRQFSTSEDSAAGVITIQGIITRIGTPLGGLLFGFLFTTSHPIIYFIPLTFILFITALFICNDLKIEESEEKI